MIERYDQDLTDSIRITQVDLPDAVLSPLVELLREAVEEGASVGFLASADANLLRDYWLSRLREAEAGERVLLVAHQGSELVGSIQLAFPSQENGRCRAEIQRLLVKRSARRRGIGSRLVRRLETIAREDGRRVLYLNTRTGDPPETMYLGLGYVAVGSIPDFALNPDGTPNTTTILYKRL